MAISPELMKRLAEEAVAKAGAREAQQAALRKKRQLVGDGALDRHLAGDGGMTEQEIADLLGISRQRVCQILHKALAKLRPLMEAAGYRDGRWR